MGGASGGGWWGHWGENNNSCSLSTAMDTFTVHVTTIIPPLFSVSFLANVLNSVKGRFWQSLVLKFYRLAMQEDMLATHH